MSLFLVDGMLICSWFSIWIIAKIYSVLRDCFKLAIMTSLIMALVYTNLDPVYKYGRELQKYTNALELPPVAYKFGKHMQKIFS